MQKIHSDNGCCCIQLSDVSEVKDTGLAEKKPKGKGYTYGKRCLKPMEDQTRHNCTTGVNQLLVGGDYDTVSWLIYQCLLG